MWWHECRDNGDKIAATQLSISGRCMRRGTNSEFEKWAMTQSWCVSSYMELVSKATSHVDCYAYGLLLMRTKSTYRLITILAVYETAWAYPGITPYVYFSIYFILCSLFRGSRLMYCTGTSNG